MCRKASSVESNDDSTSEIALSEPKFMDARKWTKEEDGALQKGIQRYGQRKWKLIAKNYLGSTRTEADCLNRWKTKLKPENKKGPWSDVEDEAIMECRKRGLTKWSEIAMHIQGREGKQCRERWLNHLDPTINHNQWTDEEDRMLVIIHSQIGNKWTQIAQRLPGRTENSVKNRWNTFLRKKRRESRTKKENASKPVPSAKKENKSATNGKLPSMRERPKNPQLSPVRMNALCGGGETLTPVSHRHMTTLSSLGPDAPHRKLSEAEDIRRTSGRARKILPSLSSGSGAAAHTTFDEAELRTDGLSSALPFVVRSAAPSSPSASSTGSNQRRSKRVFHHQRSRPPKLESVLDDHGFKVPTPRDPTVETPGVDGDNFFGLRLTPRSTSSRPPSTRSTGSNRSFGSTRDLSEARVEKMANEFVKAEARRREILRGIKLNDAEKVMMKRAFIAGLRNPSSIVSPAAAGAPGHDNLGDVQWEFDPSESLDAMGFSFEEDGLENVVIEPIALNGKNPSSASRAFRHYPTPTVIEPISLTSKRAAKWPEYEPEAGETDVDNMSLSMLSMSLDDSTTSHDVADFASGNLISGAQIHQSFNVKNNGGESSLVSPI